MDNSFLRAASTLLLLNNYNESQPLEFCYDEDMWLYHHEIFFAFLFQIGLLANSLLILELNLYQMYYIFV